MLSLLLCNAIGPKGMICIKLRDTNLSFRVSSPDHDGDAGGGGCNESGGGQPPEVDNFYRIDYCQLPEFESLFYLKIYVDIVNYQKS